VLVASDPRAWPDLVLEEHSYKTFELADMSYNQHVIAVNIGASITCEYRRGSRWHHVRKHKGAISLFPSRHTFHRRLKTSANVLYLAISPSVYMQDSIYGLPQPEFVEGRKEEHSTLFHIALALKGAVTSGLAQDSLFGRSIAIGLARHLMKCYSTSQQRSAMPLIQVLDSRRLRKAVDYMRAHLHAGITVADIAGAIQLSPFHFARLFKTTTGYTPHQFVMKARVEKARELLLSSSTPLKQIAVDLGFADQSHFTRQFKLAYHVTPGVWLRSR
jgi:AraC family transcriptional regulator